MRSSNRFLRPASELAVIVLGILLALAADSWWEGRKERALEREYLSAFREDVRQTLGENERVTAEQSATQSEVVQLLESITRGDPLPDTIRRMFPPVTIPAESMDTYRDLVASGGTTLISDPAVRRVMAQLLQRIEYNDRTEDWALEVIASARMLILGTDPGSLGRDRFGEIWALYADAGERLIDGQLRTRSVAEEALRVLDAALDV